jgi:hypothetical protein
MPTIRQTRSLCNTCYREVPAVVSAVDGRVILTKQCSDHGVQQGLVERDAAFYWAVSTLTSPTIYDGHFVDVTRKCNLRCTYCYYPLEKQDPAGAYSIDSIVEECILNAHRAPFIITGGEPTTRDDIVDALAAVKRVGPVELLTNGVRLAADPELCRRVFRQISHGSSFLNLNLSVHRENGDAWADLLRHCRTEGLTVESALIVVDSEQSFRDSLKIVNEFQDVVAAWRIKAASRIWNEQKPEQKIFTSDLLKWLQIHGGDSEPVLVRSRGNKPSIINVAWNGTVLMLVSWYDTSNIDLDDIACPPTYRAKNGEVANFVTACLINEGMSKGWLKGQRL